MSNMSVYENPNWTQKRIVWFSEGVTGTVNFHEAGNFGLAINRNLEDLDTASVSYKVNYTSGGYPWSGEGTISLGDNCLKFDFKTGCNDISPKWIIDILKDTLSD